MQTETIRWIILIIVILLAPAIDLLSGEPINVFGVIENKKDE